MNTLKLAQALSPELHPAHDAFFEGLKTGDIFVGLTNFGKGPVLLRIVRALDPRVVKVPGTDVLIQYLDFDVEIEGFCQARWALKATGHRRNFASRVSVLSRSPDTPYVVTSTIEKLRGYEVASWHIEPQVKPYEDEEL